MTTKISDKVKSGKEYMLMYSISLNVYEKEIEYAGPQCP